MLVIKQVAEWSASECGVCTVTGLQPQRRVHYHAASAWWYSFRLLEHDLGSEFHRHRPTFHRRRRGQFFSSLFWSCPRRDLIDPLLFCLSDGFALSGQGRLFNHECCDSWQRKSKKIVPGICIDERLEEDNVWVQLCFVVNILKVLLWLQKRTEIWVGHCDILLWLVRITRDLS